MLFQNYTDRNQKITQSRLWNKTAPDQSATKHEFFDKRFSDYKRQVEDTMARWVLSISTFGAPFSSADYRIMSGRRWRSIHDCNLHYVHTDLIRNHYLGGVQLAVQPRGTVSDTMIFQIYKYDKINGKDPLIYFIEKIHGYSSRKKRQRFQPSMILDDGLHYWVYYGFNQFVDISKMIESWREFSDQRELNHPSIKVHPRRHTEPVPMPFSKGSATITVSGGEIFPYGGSDRLKMIQDARENYKLIPSLNHLFPEYKPQPKWFAESIRQSVTLDFHKSHTAPRVPERYRVYKRQKDSRRFDLQGHYIYWLNRKYFSNDLLRKACNYILKSKELKNYSDPRFTEKRAKANALRLCMLAFMAFKVETDKLKEAVPGIDFSDYHYPVPANFLKTLDSRYHRPFYSVFVPLFTKLTVNYSNGSYNRHCKVFELYKFTEVLNQIMSCNKQLLNYMTYININLNIDILSIAIKYFIICGSFDSVARAGP